MALFNRLLLLATPETRDMAADIKNRATYHADVEVIEWDRRFPDGFPDQRIQTPLRGRDVCFLASFHSPDAIERQTGIIWAVPRFGARSLRVVAPFFPGTMERVRPQDITTTALFSVEGELDDISGSGQTEAVHNICSGVPKARQKHLQAKGAGHYGIFSGRRWREVVYPEVKSFILSHHQGAEPVAVKRAAPRTKAAAKKAVRKK